MQPRRRSSSKSQNSDGPPLKKRKVQQEGTPHEFNALDHNLESVAPGESEELDSFPLLFEDDLGAVTDAIIPTLQQQDETTAPPEPAKSVKKNKKKDERRKSVKQGKQTVEEIKKSYSKKRLEKIRKQAIKDAKEEYEEERNRVLMQLPHEVKDQFGQIGFGKFGKKWYPVLLISPYDVALESVRAEWYVSFEKALEGRIKFAHLGFWIGETNYSPLGQNLFVPLHAANKERKWYDAAKTRLEKGLDPKGPEEAYLMRAAEEVEKLLEIEPQDRWQRIPHTKHPFEDMSIDEVLSDMIEKNITVELLEADMADSIMDDEEEPAENGKTPIVNLQDHSDDDKVINAGGKTAKAEAEILRKKKKAKKVKQQKGKHPAEAEGSLERGETREGDSEMKIEEPVPSKLGKTKQPSKKTDKRKKKAPVETEKEVISVDEQAANIHQSEKAVVADKPDIVNEIVEDEENDPASEDDKNDDDYENEAELGLSIGDDDDNALDRERPSKGKERKRASASEERKVKERPGESKRKETKPEEKTDKQKREWMSRTFNRNEKLVVPLLEKLHHVDERTSSENIREILSELEEMIPKMCWQFIELHKVPAALKPAKKILKSRSDDVSLLGSLREKMKVHYTVNKSQYPALQRKIPCETSYLKPEPEEKQNAINDNLRSEEASRKRPAADSHQKVEECHPTRDSIESLTRPSKKAIEIKSPSGMESQPLDKPIKRKKNLSRNEPAESLNGLHHSKEELISAEHREEPLSMKDSTTVAQSSLSSTAQDEQKNISGKSSVTDSQRKNDLFTKQVDSGRRSPEKPKPKKFSIASLLKPAGHDKSAVQTKQTTYKEKEADRPKKQLPSWMCADIKFSPPHSRIRLFALEFFKEMSRHFPSDQVNQDGIALQLEAEAYRWATQKSKAKDIEAFLAKNGEYDGLQNESTRLYWKKVHAIVAVVCGKYNPGSLMHEIMQGNFETARDLVELSDERLNLYFAADLGL